MEKLVYLNGNLIGAVLDMNKSLSGLASNKGQKSCPDVIFLPAFSPFTIQELPEPDTVSIQ